MDFSEYARPSLAVDPVVLYIVDGQLMTRLWRRRWDPDAGKWALPGVFVSESESLEDAVRRGMSTKVDIDARYIEQLFTWNKPERDERGWVVSVAYYAIVSASQRSERAPSGEILDFAISVEGSGDAVQALVTDDKGERIQLAFDHEDILAAVIRRLRAELWQTNLALHFLDEVFTLRALQNVYEAILGRTLNKDSFRRRVTQTQELVQATGAVEENVSHRPAELYRSTTS